VRELSQRVAEPIIGLLLLYRKPSPDGGVLASKSRQKRTPKRSETTVFYRADFSPFFRPATEVGGVAVLIDAKNERAANWYASYGAVPLADAPRSLLLPLATVQAVLASAGKL
jgi:hypothetical protein